MKKLLKAFEFILLLMISTVIISIIMFSLLIPETKTIDNRIHIHAMKDYDLNESTIKNLLKKSPLNSNTKVNAFILPKYLYVLTNLRGVLGSQGVAYPLINTIFINENVAKETQRTIDQVIVHETTHIDTYEKFGLYKTLFVPGWKMEGIADYVAKSSSFTPQQRVEIIKKYKEGGSLSSKEKYVVYQEKVALLMNSGMSVEKLFNSDIKSDF